MCEAFDANPALVALRSTEDVDAFVARVVDFWATEEKVLEQLYGAAAVDPAAAALVARQRTDRNGEIRRLLRRVGTSDRRAFAALAVLTSFETYRELRRNAGLSRRDVTGTLQESARRLVA
jgi:hypothetical protein